MGTSTSNSGTSGSGTPLVPSWLDPGSSTIGDQPGSSDTNTEQQMPDLPEAGEANRYQAARGAFSRFARSGGSDRRSMGRAISSYVSKTSGGSSGATQRMGSSRGTAARVLNFLNEVTTNGLDETLRTLNLEELAGKPIDEVFMGISDFLLPEGGTTDIGIAREAFMQTVAQLADAGVEDLNSLSDEQVASVMEMYVTNAIELRMYNEIGTQGVSIPQDEAAAENVQDVLHDFIESSVTAAMADIRNNGGRINSNQTLDYVDKVYQKSFDFLSIYAEELETGE